MNLLDYHTSPFYLFLNAITPVIFCGALMVYVYVRGFYTEKLRSFIDMLLMFITCMILAMIFRFYGDATMSGDTVTSSLELLQSLALVLSGAFFAMAGYKLQNLFGGEE